MTLPQPEESVDALLERAERMISKLSDTRLPLDELIHAYEEAGRLLAEAETRFGALKQRIAS